jgi:hypothetical protein
MPWHWPVLVRDNFGWRRRDDRSYDRECLSSAFNRTGMQRQMDRATIVAVVLTVSMHGQIHSMTDPFHVRVLTLTSSNAAGLRASSNAALRSMKQSPHARIRIMQGSSRRLYNNLVLELSSATWDPSNHLRRSASGTTDRHAAEGCSRTRVAAIADRPAPIAWADHAEARRPSWGSCQAFLGTPSDRGEVEDRMKRQRDQ